MTADVMHRFEVTYADGYETTVLARSRGAARWGCVSRLVDVGMETPDALRFICSVRRTIKPTIEEALQAECDAWNAAHPVGTRVRYWTGLREGRGELGEVRAPARAVCGHVVAWLDTYHSCVAVSHIEALA